MLFIESVFYSSLDIIKTPKKILFLTILKFGMSYKTLNFNPIHFSNDSNLRVFNVPASGLPYFHSYDKCTPKNRLVLVLCSLYSCYPAYLPQNENIGGRGKKRETICADPPSCYEKRRRDR